MEWDEKNVEALLNMGIAAIRNNIATKGQIEEAASRVVRNLQIELPTGGRTGVRPQSETEYE